MISPIIAAQTSSQAVVVQRADENQAVLQNQNAFQNVREEERQVREVVLEKERAAFYEQRHDAKEESKNKYENLYTNKKKEKKEGIEEKKEINRVNFDIKI